MSDIVDDTYDDYPFSKGYYKKIYDSLVPELKFLTREYYKDFFEKKGLRAACYEIDIVQINKQYIKGLRTFDFYVNQYKLVFFLDDQFKANANFNYTESIITVDFILENRIDNLKILL